MIVRFHSSDQAAVAAGGFDLVKKRKENRAK
jgi:hypothetical protein